MGRRPAAGREYRRVPYPAFDGTQSCHRSDPAVFFPAFPNMEAYEEAAVICSGCPFLASCHEYAVAHDVAGFWAGTTLTRRREIRTELGIAALKVSSADHELLELLLLELDKGRPAHEVAVRAGCTPETVYRHRQRRAA